MSENAVVVAEVAEGKPTGAGLPAFVEPASLPEAATLINRLGRNLAEHAYLLGKALLWAKAKVGHGHFGDWVRENVWFSMRTAQRFMGFATACEGGGRLLEYHPAGSDSMTHLAAPDFDNLADALVYLLEREIEADKNGAPPPERSGIRDLRHAWSAALHEELESASRSGDIARVLRMRDKARRLCFLCAEVVLRCERRLGRWFKSIDEVVGQLHQHFNEGALASWLADLASQYPDDLGYLADIPVKVATAKRTLEEAPKQNVLPAYEAASALVDDVVTLWDRGETDLERVAARLRNAPAQIST
ncbi:MAG: DUF3102 domain-containing protein [Planctomycetes bacterium]|nr:DUF3102 domain-containing protein [Planctomycetota bacterium]